MGTVSRETVCFQLHWMDPMRPQSRWPHKDEVLTVLSTTGDGTSFFVLDRDERLAQQGGYGRGRVQALSSDDLAKVLMT